MSAKKYFFFKSKNRFLTPRGKLKSKFTIYAVFNFKHELRIKSLEQVRKCFLVYFKEQQRLGLVPANFNYLKFFNLNQKDIKKVGRKFHIDFVCDGKELPLDFFNNWPHGDDKLPVKVQYLKNSYDLKDVIEYISKQMDDYRSSEHFKKYGIKKGSHLYRFS